MSATGAGDARSSDHAHSSDRAQREDALRRLTLHQHGVAGLDQLIARGFTIS